MTEMPVVGGDHHGQVWAIPDERFAVTYDLDAPVLDHSVVTLPVARFACIMPGRTDLQRFEVIVDSQDRSAKRRAWDAIRTAWAAGWSPGDDTSEARGVRWQMEHIHRDD